MKSRSPHSSIHLTQGRKDVGNLLEWEMPKDKYGRSRVTKGRQACSVIGQLPQRTRAIILRVNFILHEP